ncbi:MAG: DUF438 domain-containing protein [Firmicutes bacterium]|nr:DUF438 domain-containing protein [Bacillota bacterium]
MSEILNNQAYRQDQLKEIILDLHRGKDFDEVKARFERIFGDVDSTEIARLEQKLIQEGLPEEQVQRLCDVHVNVFRDSLDRAPEPEAIPGHPVHTFKSENAAVEELIEKELKPTLEKLKSTEEEGARRSLVQTWREAHRRLLGIENHYSRKENVLFPFLEKHGITGPTTVMWGIHDDIRAQLKKISELLEYADEAPRNELASRIDKLVLPALTSITEMIYKEHKILFPMSLETLSEAEWQNIYNQSDEIGYTLVRPGREWEARADQKELTPEARPSEGILNPEDILNMDTGSLKLDTGSLTPREINLILKNLPVDITFVDKDNAVRYFSQGRDRIFTRTPAVIGRKVESCHPPESVHVVRKIVDDFKAGRRDTADFWITMNGRFIVIRYLAIRDEKGEYVGVLEVTQDVSEIRRLAGEKRLLDEPATH